MAQAEIIFTGTVIASNPTDEAANICWKYSTDKPQCGSKIATFQIDQAWKGKPTETVKIYSKDACYCLGAYFEPNGKYLVFAHKTRKGIEADCQASNVCFGTRPLYDPSAQAIIMQLEQHKNSTVNSD